MRRDRLMTGVQNSGIDFDWLMANLEVGTVATGVDETPLPPIETFVLGPKAKYAAETYVLALFQLYPTIYFHKTTRVAEKVFTTLMLRLIGLAREGAGNKSAVVKPIGLQRDHPILRFAREPDKLERALALDDTVFWGVLPLLAESPDQVIRDCALRLRDRRLPKCYDIREKLIAAVAPEWPRTKDDRESAKKRLDRLRRAITNRLQEWSDADPAASPRILVDYATRSPYKPFHQTTGLQNQILFRAEDDKIHDMAEVSPVMSGLETFELFRAYFDRADEEARTFVVKVVAEELRRTDNA